VIRLSVLSFISYPIPSTIQSQAREEEFLFVLSLDACVFFFRPHFHKTYYYLPLYIYYFYFTERGLEGTVFFGQDD
jgi:hypothetical protein